MVRNGAQVSFYGVSIHAGRRTIPILRNIREDVLHRLFWTQASRRTSAQTWLANPMDMVSIAMSKYMLWFK